MAEHRYQRIIDALDASAPIPTDSQHFEAVGRFVTRYALAEAAVHMLARKVLGVSDEKGRVIFANMRLGDIVDRVRAIMRADKSPYYAEVDDCLIHLDKIAKRRHNLVHRTTSFTDGKLIVTNVFVSKTKDIFEVEPFTYNELSDLIGDCAKIYLQLNRIRKPESADPRLNEFLASSWRYKPPQPKPRNSKRRGNRGLKKHQPRSSPV